MGDRVRLDLGDDGVAEITLDDPGRRNALSHELTRELATTVATALSAGAGAIVLAAEPPVFCAGGSLDDLIEPKADLPEAYAGFLALAEAPVPTIAAVGGPAIGAGVNLPLACDVVLCSPAARFDPRWLDVGIHPGGGHLRRLAERIGRQGAAALVLCGDVLDGPTAVAAGMTWRCVPDEDLLATARGLAARAASRDRELVARTKATLDATERVGSEEALAVELEAQRWSMARPGFRERLLELQATLSRRRA